MKRQAIGCICLLAVAGELTAATTPGQDPLGPKPVVEPAIPGAEVSRTDPHEQLLKTMLRRRRWIDERIKSLLAANGGLPPQVVIKERPELSDVKKERDEAWANLAAILTQPTGGIVERPPDDIEQPADETGEGFLRELAAQNALAMALVYKDLYEKQGRRTLDVLKKGAAYIDKVDEERLPFSQRPQRRYFQIWFLAEQLRLLEPGADRVALVAEVRRLVKDFAISYPESELQENAKWLLEVIDLEKNVESTRKRVYEESGPGLQEEAAKAKEQP